MAEPLAARPGPCTCADCLDEGLRFPNDPVQLSLIAGGLAAPAEPAPILLDTPAAATAGVSDPKPHRRGRTLAATIAGDDR